jgi:hypothetical protein
LIDPRLSSYSSPSNCRQNIVTYHRFEEAAMDATRRRFGSLLEWLVAVACVAAGVVLVSRAVDEFRSVRPIVPVIAKEAAPVALMTGIPAGVAPVPLLLLTDDRELRLGDRLADVAARLGSSALLLSESVDDLGAKRRLTRFYNDLGAQFILVFEGTGHDGEARLSAIFVH